METLHFISNGEDPIPHQEQLLITTLLGVVKNHQIWIRAPFVKKTFHQQNLLQGWSALIYITSQ
jgi:hypothetical protein